MNKSWCRPLAICGFAMASLVLPTLAREAYVIDVPGNDTRVLTAGDVVLFSNCDLVKTGTGTLKAGDEMSAFTGTITVSNGYYVATTVNALGTSDGETWADGGTLIFRLAKTPAQGAAFPNESLHLKGTGMSFNGALRGESGSTDTFRKVFLEGDTLVTTTTRTDFRTTYFYMNGHKLTVRANRGGFYLVYVSIQNCGDFDVENGMLEFQGGNTGTSSSRSVTVRSGASLSVWRSTTDILNNFIFEPGATLVSTAGEFTFPDTGYLNYLNGPSVVLQGQVKTSLSPNVQVQFRAPLSGDGGFSGTGGYLQFFTANTFTGGVDLQGTLGDVGNAQGGVVLRNGAAIPETGAPVKIKDADLILGSGTSFALPDLVLDGRVNVTGVAWVASCTAKSLVKTGEGTLSVYGPLRITGDADIRSGTFRFARRIPNFRPGLHWVGNQTGDNASELTTEDAMKRHKNYKGIDRTGMSYAYNWWPGGKGFYHYLGYFKVPGAEGTAVRCRFTSCMRRHAKLWIDDAKVLQVDDSTVSVPANATAIGWSRHYWTDPLTLTAGWHKIAFYSYGEWSTDNGPVGYSEYIEYGLWPSLFGLGVDFDATTTLANQAKIDGGFVDATVTNSARYVKFVDPGDASFLRASLDDAKTSGDIVASNYRPSFDGNVAFGAGTVLDLNDFAPYVSLPIPSLIGVPTIRNGAVQVSSPTWKIRFSDLINDAGEALGKPLTVDGDASLTFPNGPITVDASATDLELLTKFHKTRTCPLVADLAAFPDNSFVLSAGIQATGWYLKREGNVLALIKVAGLQVIVQ